MNPMASNPRAHSLAALALAGLGWLGLPVWADEALSESVITATLPGRTIAALVTHRSEHDAFRRAVLLLPGHPGIMKIESAQAFAMKGNFLIRSRRHWLDRETLVFSVDAPSDEWAAFSVQFRSTQRYAQDIRALIDVIRAQYGALPLTFVGTSEGSISAYYAAKAEAARTPAPADTKIESKTDLKTDLRAVSKVIFSSSLFLPSRNARGMVTLDFDNFPAPMLWVHHASDPCRFTPYREAQRLAEQTKSPLITVQSSNPGRGEPCEAQSPHGFIGAEVPTVQAMKAWMVSGAVQDVLLP
jgi:hypothetical protein